MISDQAGLVVHLPEMGADTMGYHAVGSGLFLFVFTLLLVGMLGLYASPNPDGPKVIKYGDSRARYVLVEEDCPSERTPRTPKCPRRGRAALRRPAVRRHRTARRAERRG